MSWSNRNLLDQRITAMRREAVKAAAQQLAKNAEELVETQKRFADAAFSDPTGKLQATIRQEDASQGGKLVRKVSVGGRGVPYPPWVEHGHGDATPRPFFWPAYRLKKRAFKARVSRAVKKAIKDAAK